jgi:hypothetical protein
VIRTRFLTMTGVPVFTPCFTILAYVVRLTLRKFKMFPLKIEATVC